MLSRMRVDTTDREDTPVIYAASPGGPDDIQGAAQRAWRDLEAVLQPKGRKAFGYWLPQEREYRACFSLEEGDDPEVLGLRQSVIPGGLCRRARLRGEDLYGKIGPRSTNWRRMRRSTTPGPGSSSTGGRTRSTSSS
jgi:DNA gyrase inhibitor GyrI